MPALSKVAKSDEEILWGSSLPKRRAFAKSGGYDSGQSCVCFMHDIGSERFNIGDRATRVYYDDRDDSDFDYIEFGCTATAVLAGCKSRQGKLKTGASIVVPRKPLMGQSVRPTLRRDIDARRPDYVDRCSHISRLVSGIFTGRSTDPDDEDHNEIKDGWEPTDYPEFVTADQPAWDPLSKVDIEVTILEWQDGTDGWFEHTSDTVESLYAAAEGTRMARFLTSVGDQTEEQ